MKIKQWIADNRLPVVWLTDIIFSIGETRYCVLEPKDGLIIRSVEFEKKNWWELIVDDDEYAEVQKHKVTHYVYFFGRYWYTSPIVSENVEFNVFKYVGQSEHKWLNTKMPFLGIHGRYELCNGSRQYSEWCSKAKFLGIESLGICELNTLAGTLPFQLSCEKSKVKPIIGESVRVKTGKDFVVVKLYVRNERGWRNLLHINAQINVFNEHYVDEGVLLEKAEGLAIVIPSTVELEDKMIKKYRNAFNQYLYFQFDPVQYAAEDKDTSHLNVLKNYYNNFQKKILPVLITDAYYLDKEDAHIKKKLNAIGKSSTDYASIDQFFKSGDDVFDQLRKMIKDEKDFTSFTEKLSNTTNELAAACDFKIPIGELHLPEYEMDVVQSAEFASNEELFWSIIEQGMQRKVIEKGKDADEYFARLQVEIDVVNSGGLQDYFLILWDIISWCKTVGILTGVGRGSAGGSLIAYLMDITKLDPIEHGLLFERFLNAGRVGKSLPDIDVDFAGNRRDEVKRYMEGKYGYDYVTSIGTYGTLKNKAAIKELGRMNQLTPQYMNYITAILPTEGGASWREMFDIALEAPQLKQFLIDNAELVNDIQLLINQPKTPSIHAAGVVIVPKTYKGEKMTIYDWMPVKKMDGVLVSEWEGPYIESAGFLKEDILGIRQLDKFDKINQLILQNGKKVFGFEDINYEDPKVYELFQKGYNQDLFHFGSVGLTLYSQDVLPESLSELVTMIALYRPGAMDTGAHKTYIKIKFGEEQPQYDYMMEEITKPTFGLYVFQEQVMQAVQVLGGFTLVEADDIRKAMGKKLKDLLDKYKTKFIDGAIKKGCERLEANRIWDKLEVFAGYGFNKSHAAAYAMIGYFCQYLKCYYPMEFWTTALEFSKDVQITHRIAEISQLKDKLKMLPPDINQSDSSFKADFKTSTIYWAITKIKQVGDATVKVIIDERNKNGKFFSLEEFRSRLPKGDVNKRTLMNLILAGCFDQVEKIVEVRDRMRLVIQVCEWNKDPIPTELYDYPLTYDFYWILIQKLLTGFGFLDYKRILEHSTIPNAVSLFIDPDRILLESSVDTKVVAGGILNQLIVKKTKQGKAFAQLILECNNQMLEITLWEETWLAHMAELSKAKNNLIFISGRVQFDKWKKHNTIRTDDSSIVEIV